MKITPYWDDVQLELVNLLLVRSERQVAAQRYLSALAIAVIRRLPQGWQSFNAGWWIREIG